MRILAAVVFLALLAVLLGGIAAIILILPLLPVILTVGCMWVWALERV